MYQLIATIFIILTIFACVVKPQLHKSVFVFDSGYTIVEKPEPVDEEIILPQKPVVNKVETQKIKQQQTKNVTEKVQTKVQTPKTETKNTKPVKELTKKTSQNVVAPVTIKKEEKEQQELILWNVWRSNLQNQIMKDTDLPIVPEGIVFRFQFDVDKYGRVSNVKTWSLTPYYTPYAIQYIAPVIRSYQGHEILNFPAGSNRISTTVEGGWKISKRVKFSTPADYKDSEKVIKR